MKTTDRPKAERAEIATMVGMLAETWRQKCTDVTIQVYEIGLDGVAIDRVRLAVMKAIQEGGKFMPSPGELRALTGEMTAKSRALKAWDKAQWARRIHGGYRTIRFSDPVTSATIRSMGGWPTFCWSEGEEEHWHQKRFLDFYERILERGVGTEEAETLLGVCAQENGYSGNGEAKGLAVATGAAAVEVDCELPALPGQAARLTGRAAVPQVTLKAP